MGARGALGCNDRMSDSHVFWRFHGLGRPTGCGGVMGCCELRRSSDPMVRGEPTRIVVAGPIQPSVQQVASRTSNEVASEISQRPAIHAAAIASCHCKGTRPPRSLVSVRPASAAGLPACGRRETPPSAMCHCAESVDELRRSHKLQRFR